MAGVGRTPAGPPPSHTGSQSIYQNQQQHQLALRQSLHQQQQQIRMSEGEETLLSFRGGGGIHGVMGRNSFPSSSHHGSQLRNESQSRGQGGEAYLQFATQNTRNQDLHMRNMEMQEFMSCQAANQEQSVMYTRSCDERNEPMSSQAQANMENIANNRMLMAQLQALQAWALERNIDLSLPANADLITQVLPIWQSAQLALMQRANEVSARGQGLGFPPFKQEAMPSTIGNETLVRGNSLSDLSGQAGAVRGPQILPYRSVSGDGTSIPVDSNSMQMQYLRQMHQLNRPPSLPAGSLSEFVGPQIPSHDEPARVPQQHTGFTKQQLHVLKAQILAFRHLKEGKRILPQEVLRAIAPPPFDSLSQQPFPPPGMVKQEMTVLKNVEEYRRYLEANEKALQPSRSSKFQLAPKVEPFTGEERETMVNHIHGATGTASIVKLEQRSIVSVKPEHEAERQSQVIPMKIDHIAEKGKTITMNDAKGDAGQAKKSSLGSGSPLSIDALASRKYHGPLFDSPLFTRRDDALGSTPVNNSNSPTLAYDVKDLLFKEGMEVLNKKRAENMEKISDLLAVNLERKRIRPDLVLKLQIENKKLRLLDLQARLRDEVDQEQQEIMAMPERPYRTFIRQCERQRIELLRHVQNSQKVLKEMQIKSIFQWRKKLLEAHWAIRDARTIRNRGVAKYHERMLREFSKRKDDDRIKRMEALENNDVDRYGEMLLEQQTNILGDAAQRYAVLSSFLSQTEEYLHTLGGKITTAKNHQEVEDAVNTAAAAARSQGLSEEEVRAAAACAREEVMIRNRFSEMNAPKVSSSINKYYNLAHAVNERVVRQPSLLRAGNLRDYQIVGLQWMLSLYNNKLNGILADEMGLGKTVQVMALIAYLMEFKGNYGPHLIIVPNAVLVIWKSELHNWLPSAKCIFYVGAKDRRSNMFSQEVRAMKFNVLVTTYEFVMYDRSKLSKINWKYIIIDEAQRMKDRESVLARDLDRYSCQRRLLLTGTPLQNDLKELWSLLNLLLPEVFDNRRAFHDWFSKPFQREGPSQNEDDDDWLETEKKVIIIHRLHQILEPFMLRRRVEDVEGSLPQKVSVVLRCRISAIQGAIYDWIKSTGTIRVDPEDELRRVAKNPRYHARMYKNLNNKCMELRKACNHPLLNYPYFSDYSTDFVVRSCGKLWMLDRILIKLHRSGHRVLLFSTMTKLLDILEEYLQWRRLIYRRIDGTTSLEDRESAIVEFNKPHSDSFIFLLSIRAAGRGINLQSADTVVIYDPDPNPQNEEQAVARAHRIGQKSEVKVIYLEAVVDKISSYQKEDDLRIGGRGDLEEDLAGEDRYMGSIESLIRSKIQKYKIDMADEVINAGRFDQRTTHEERRMTLETLLHDDDRYQETVHDVPSLHEVNQMIARSEEEVELFDQMDEEFDWTGEMVKHNQVPKWLRVDTKALDAAVAALSKKPSKNMAAGSVDLESSRSKRRRWRPKVYRELGDEDGEDSDSCLKRNAYSLHEEEGETREFEDEEYNDSVDAHPNNKNQSKEERMACDGGGYESSQIMEEAGSSGSSQKFGSLSALDSRPKRMPDELEGGEFAGSGVSFLNLQQSRSWNHDRDDDENEQVLQPKIKRKRTLRARPRPVVERLEEKLIQINPEIEPFSEPVSHRHNTDFLLLKQRHSVPSRKTSHVKPQKSNRLHYLSGSGKDALENSRESWNPKATIKGDPSFTRAKVLDSLHRKCKDVISKLLERIEKDSYQIAPILYNLWKRDEDSTSMIPAATPSNIVGLRGIDCRVDNLEYSDVMDFIEDVQLVLKNAVQHCSYSHEARLEAGRLHDMFLDIVSVTFPGTDLREARNMFRSRSPVGPTVTSSSKQGASAPVRAGRSKRRMKIHGLDPEPGPTKSAAPGPFPREDGPPPQLGNLVICKKKRKDRDKAAVKQRAAGSASPGPGVGRDARVPGQRVAAHQTRQGVQPIGWINWSGGV